MTIIERFVTRHTCHRATLVLLLVFVCGQVCSSQTVGLRRDRCLWQCADSGVYINCAADQMVAGTCTSNQNQQCNQDAYCPDLGGQRFHGVLCCTVRAYNITTGKNF